MSMYRLNVMSMQSFFMGFEFNFEDNVFIVCGYGIRILVLCYWFSIFNYFRDWCYCGDNGKYKQIREVSVFMIELQSWSYTTYFTIARMAQ